MTHLDTEILRRIEQAEQQQAPTPPAFVDTLVRLSKAGYIQGDPQRVIRITDRGRRFLDPDGVAR